MYLAKRKRFYSLCLSAALLLSATTQANELRSEKNQQRDSYRHPTQTLAFFGIKKTDTVVEIWPGGGWYSEILAPMLHDKGTFYAAHFPSDIDNSYFKRSRSKYESKLLSNPVYENVIVTSFNPGHPAKIAPDNSADKVVTFRNLHNWYIYNGEQGTIEAFKRFYAALKPGGVLGVVDHRLPESADQQAQKKSGYIKMSLAISWALQAGFVLEASSEINANPKDTADHKNGVWTLPPSLRGAKDADEKEKLKNIGESDRFTLKFRKPVSL